jgi:hypothetical protein
MCVFFYGRIVCLVAIRENCQAVALYAYDAKQWTF